MQNYTQISAEELEEQKNDNIIKALSCKVRRDILYLINDCILQPREIAEKASLQINIIKKHLAVLQKAGLVKQLKRGNIVAYQLNKSMLLWIIDQIKNIMG